MRIIQNLSELIGDKVADARKYIVCAVKNRDERKDLADVLYQISVDDMRHMAMLHEAVARIIDDYRRENGDPPPEMLAVYDYLHEQHIDRAAEVKALQAMYQER